VERKANKAWAETQARGDIQGSKMCETKVGNIKRPDSKELGMQPGGKVSYCGSELQCVEAEWIQDGSLEFGVWNLEMKEFQGVPRLRALPSLARSLLPCNALCACLVGKHFSLHFPNRKSTKTPILCFKLGPLRMIIYQRLCLHLDNSHQNTWKPRQWNPGISHLDRIQSKRHEKVEIDTVHSVDTLVEATKKIK